MDAFVTAGGIPETEDPLYASTQGQPKALLNVAGKPMIQWVLDALSGAARIERVVVVGLNAGAGVQCSKPTTYIPNQVSLLDNIQAGVNEILRLDPQAGLVMAVSSDIPALTPAIVDWAADRAQETEHDIYYMVAERSVMESRFPGSNRSYVRLRDAEVCGSDMNVLRAGLVSDRPLWERIVASRKNALRQASLLGWDVLALLLLGRLSISRAERMVSKRLGLRGRVILCPYPELAMDVDKPHQLEILRKYLSSQVRSTA
jgi:GTP:adenosylcobinamide-phosphate guanylyltransferase